MYTVLLSVFCLALAVCTIAFQVMYEDFFKSLSDMAYMVFAYIVFASILIMGSIALYGIICKFIGILL